MKIKNIVKRYICEGIVRNHTPIIIGSGDDTNFVDISFIKDHNNKPYLPGTSLSGVIRHLTTKMIANGISQEDFNLFWGMVNVNKEADYLESQIVFYDAPVKEKYKIGIRDGIEIDRKSITAAKSKKYQFEVLESGCEFNIKFELIIVKDVNIDAFEKILFMIINLLQDGFVKIGAKTMSGLGSIVLEKIEIFKFDFSMFSHVKAWIMKDYKSQKIDFNNNVNFDQINFHPKAKITCEFEVVSSILIKSYPKSFDNYDVESFKSGDSYLIPGTSLKGVIRSRIEKILHSVINDENKISQYISELFGKSSENSENEGGGLKSRLLVKESKLSNLSVGGQTRIAIDKFTSAPINGALFNELCLWSIEDDKIHFTTSIELWNTKNHHRYLALLMLAMKDIWSGFLAVGSEANIGRGWLKGHKLSATWIENSKILQLEIDRKTDNNIKISSNENARKLNKYLAELIGGDNI